MIEQRLAELTRQMESLEAKLRHVEILFERRKGSPQKPQPHPEAGPKKLVLAATA